jgi:hypothetical protein
MDVRRTLCLLALLALSGRAAAARAAPLAQAETPTLPGDNRAALVIDKGEAGVEQYCVAFPEAEITGYEALQRAGLTVATDVQAGGAAVCQIGDTGCPADDCFCACRGGGECLYWSYWRQQDGVWAYSMAGSSLSPVRDGAVEGWVWGPGSVTQAPPPPAASFGEVCVGGAVVAGGATVSEAGEARPRQETGSEGAEERGRAGAWLPYAAFAGLIALLGALAVMARRRRERSE